MSYPDDMARLGKNIKDFRDDDSDKEALTWQHSASCLGLQLLWQLIDSLNDIYNELAERNKN